MTKDLSIVDLSAGFNNTDPPTSLADNQCTVATNVDFWRNKCGAKRNGGTAITLPSSISSKTEVTFLHRHFPSTDQTAIQLWALGVTLGVSLQLSYKDTAWHDVTFVDAPTNSGVYPYQFTAQSFHGKLFLAYKSGVDRMHVWDGTTLRATGLTQPSAAPTAANAGVGTLAGTRYYRVRETVMSGSSVTLRSEPSVSLTFSPSGTGASITVTKPATTNTSATHWELEASLNNADYYVIATTVIGTTTYSDTIAATVGYSASLLSEESGAYTNIPSGRYLVADQDRLIIGGSFESETQASVVRWTTVLQDPGVGNDERIPVATDNSLNLDGNDGGGLTGLAGPINGVIYAFKRSQVYKLIRTGQRSSAYEPVAVSKTVGAIEGSIVEGVDEAGKPVLYFTDSKLGPFRIGSNGLLTAGSDIATTWTTVNLDATKIVARSVYYPNKQQIHWWWATSGADIPNTWLTLQTDSTQVRQDGLRFGWTNNTGPSTAVKAACLFSTNIELNIARSVTLKPFIAVGNAVLMMDTGTTDNGTSFTGTVVTRPYLVTSSLNDRFGIRAASIILDADATAVVGLSLIRDFGLETSSSVNISGAPAGTEDPVIGFADNLFMSNAKVIQAKVTDGTGNTGQWSLHRIDLVTRVEETN